MRRRPSRGRSSTPERRKIVGAPPSVSSWPLLAICPYHVARWGHAMRPWSFTASYFPMLLTALVLSTEPSLSKAVWVGQETEFLLRFLLLIVAGLTVHAGANLTNTYYDYAAEVDGTQADDRTILDGHLSAQSVKNLSWACYGCSALAWAALIKMGGVPLLCVTLGGGFLGWAYTAKPFSLKYRACGELVVFLCFGPLLAFAATLALGVPVDHDMLRLPILMSLAPACLTVGILHSNNARDIVTDRAAGTATLAQWLGPDRCRQLFICLLVLPYALAVVPVACVDEIWGWRPPLFTLLTIPVSNDVYRAYQTGKLAELPQQTAQLHAVFCGAMALSMLSTATLARTMLGLLFIMGGGNNFYTWAVTLPLVRDRLALALPFELHRSFPPLLLFGASCWQIGAGTLFISGYGGLQTTRLAVQALLVFLTPITFIVHDFWATPKYGKGALPRRDQWEAAGCADGGVADPPLISTFASVQDSEFIHFFKNVCILGGLAAYLETSEIQS